MNEFEYISAFLQQTALFTPELQFALQDIHASESVLLGTRLLASYASTLSPRQVRIYFAPSNPDRAACFTVFVDEGNGESFMLKEYLEQKGQVPLANTLCNGAKLPLQQFAANFARVLYALSETELMPILSGQVWNIPPFDWTPYR